MIFTPASIVFAIVAATLAICYAVFVELHARQTEFVLEPHHEARLIELDRQAIERAYVQQITFLFQQWMKDETDQPERAVRGTNQARSAYGRAMTAIERREKAK